MLKLHTIRLSINGAFAEDHDVLGEGACLVREDELHLAKLLIQGGGASFSCSAHRTVVHLPVPVNEETVTESQDFHTEGTFNHSIYRAIQVYSDMLVSCT